MSDIREAPVLRAQNRIIGRPGWIFSDNIFSEGGIRFTSWTIVTWADKSGVFRCYINLRNPQKSVVIEGLNVIFIKNSLNNEIIDNLCGALMKLTRWRNDHSKIARAII